VVKGENNLWVEKKKMKHVFQCLNILFLISFCSVLKFNFFLDTFEMQRQTLYKSYNKACPSK
jgi:hypothetical protein